MTLHRPFDSDFDQYEEYEFRPKLSRFGPVSRLFSHIAFRDTDTLSESEPLARNVAVSTGIAVLAVAIFNGLIAGYAMITLIPDQPLFGVAVGLVVAIMVMIVDRFFLGSNHNSMESEEEFGREFWARAGSLLMRIVLSIFIAAFAAQMFLLGLFRDDALKAVELDAAAKNAALYQMADREWQAAEDQRALLNEQMTLEVLSASAVRTAISAQNSDISDRTRDLAQAEAVAKAEEEGTRGSGLAIFDGVELSGVENCGANCKTAQGVASALRAEIASRVAERSASENQLINIQTRIDELQSGLNALPTEADVRAKVKDMDEYYVPAQGVLSVIMGVAMLKQDAEHGPYVRWVEFIMHAFIIALDLAVLLGAAWFSLRTTYKIRREGDLAEVFEHQRRRIKRAKHGHPNAAQATVFDAGACT